MNSPSRVREGFLRNRIGWMESPARPFGLCRAGALAGRPAEVPLNSQRSKRLASEAPPQLSQDMFWSTDFSHFFTIFQ